MIPDEIWTRLPVILVVAAFVLMMIPRIAEASERVAKMFGPLGRHWRERQKAREDLVNRDRAAEAMVLLEEAISKQPVIDMMRRELASVMDRLEGLEQADTIQRAFISYDERHHFEASLVAARAGITMLHRIPFDEFAEKWKQGWRPD